MAKKAACPQCGAKNELDARRCRVCANLLNADIPEQPHRPKGLPDSVQRQIEAELGLSNEIPAPSFTAAPPPPPPPTGFAPPPPPPPPPSGAPLPPPPFAPPPPGGGYDPYGSPDATVGSVPGPDLQDVPDDEPFDPDALFRDMQRSHLPPPPPPPPAPDELRLPPPTAPGPDPLWSLGTDLGEDPSDQAIEEATRAALREERLRKRPGFLDRVFKGEDDQQQQ